MKTYKHKDWKLFAEERTQWLWWYRIKNKDWEDVDKIHLPELIENNNDWIEVKKDCWKWIMIKEIFDKFNSNWERLNKDEAIEIVEKHQPKISIEELDKLDAEYIIGQMGYKYKALINLLKEKWLLA